jgi:hypothetical protein
MNRATECQFCSKLLVLWVDPQYAAMGDPMKLLKLAACNTCADLRVRHRKIEETIAHCCTALNQGVRKSDMQAFRDTLATATRKYAEVIAQMHGSDTMVWDESFPELLADRPDRWGVILSKYTRDCIADWKLTANATHWNSTP